MELVLIVSFWFLVVIDDIGNEYLIKLFFFMLFLRLDFIFFVVNFWLFWNLILFFNFIFNVVLFGWWYDFINVFFIFFWSFVLNNDFVVLILIGIFVL